MSSKNLAPVIKKNSFFIKPDLFCFKLFFENLGKAPYSFKNIFDIIFAIGTGALIPD